MKNYERNFFLITLLSLGFGTVSSINVIKNIDVSGVAQDYKQAVTKEVLSNGMTVLLYRNPAVPKVLVQVAYNIGSYVEDSGERGLAHLLEHMIFKGTAKLSESDIDCIARKYGATYNAFTSYDMTSYYFETNKNNWKPFVSILADCMQNARFDDQHLASEMKAVIQELKMIKDNYWKSMVSKVISSVFPAHHPYHAPIIGYKEDLVDLSGARLKKFYDKYYHPDHAILVVVGDIDPTEVMTEIKQQFGSIPKKETPINVVFPAPSHDLTTLQTRCYEDLQNEQLAFYWRIPGLKSQHEVVTTVAAFLLGSGENSRLHRALVDEHQIAVSVGIAPYKLMEDGVFCIFIEPLPGKADACKELVQQELMRAINDGFLASEFQHMVYAQKKAFFKKLEGFEGLAYEWISSYFATNDEYALFTKVDQFEKITSQDVQTYINQHIDPFLMNTLVLLPMPDGKKDQVIKAKKASDELDKKILAARPRTTPIEEPKLLNTMKDPEPLDFSFPKPHRIVELDNGLTVLLYAHRSVPIMSLHCRFKEAGYHTKVKDSVLLDLMMGMLIEGSQGYTKQENVEFFDSFGTDYSFSDDGASLSLLRDNYPTIFKRFLHTLVNPKFPADALEKMREIVLDGCRRAKDDQKSVGFRELSNLLYKGHPFEWTFDQAMELAQNVSVADLQAFHKKFVNANNMIMSIVGDFDLDEMQNSVTSIFSSWPKGEVISVTRSTGDYEAKDVVNVPMLRDQIFLLLGQPSTLDVYHPDIVPLRLLNYITFYSLGSRIFQLREQSGLFYTASGAWANGASKDPGFDFISTILTPDNVEHVEKEMRALVNLVGTHGVTAEELAAAKQLYFKTFIDLIATNGAKANMFCTIKDLAWSFDHYDNVLKRVRSMTLDEINQIAKKYFNTENMTSIRVGRV